MLGFVSRGPGTPLEDPGVMPVSEQVLHPPTGAHPGQQVLRRTRQASPLGRGPRLACVVLMWFFSLSLCSLWPRSRPLPAPPSPFPSIPAKPLFAGKRTAT